MYYTHGGINVCFQFGFAEACSAHTMRLHVIADERTALEVHFEGARSPAYPFEPVIVAGSLVIQDDGRPVLVARQTLAASKAHVPGKLAWRLNRCPDTAPFQPIDIANKFRLFPEIIERLPDAVDWPADIRAFALREGRLFEQMLAGTLSQKRCWGACRIAGFAEYHDLITDDEDEPPTARIAFRLRPEKAAPSFEARVSTGFQSGRATIEMVRNRDPWRSPVMLMARLSLIRQRAEGESRIPHRWGFRVNQLCEATPEDIRDPLALTSINPSRAD